MRFLYLHVLLLDIEYPVNWLPRLTKVRIAEVLLYSVYCRYFQVAIHSVCVCVRVQLGADVFNALDITENKTFFDELKFGVGDGNLHYYFFNWRCPEVQPEKVW